jgi:small-conductance mechanosensitive channel
MSTDFINDFLVLFSSFKYFDYVITAILIFVGFLLAKLAARQVNKLFLTIFEKLKGKNTSLPPASFAFSIQLIVLGITLLFILKVVSPQAYLQEVATYILKAIILIGIINFGLKFSLMISFFLEKKAQKTKGKFDDLLAQVIGKALKIIVYTVGFIVGADLFGLPLNSIITGLGIGGIAVAMAAKDTIANIFGFITIVTDRPFSIGDWVRIQSNEGTVEKLGFRSTQIRTFYNSVISIPNSTFLNSSVDNMGLRKYRRFSTNLSLTYSSEADDIESFCEGVRELIRQHPQTRKDYFFVHLNNLSDSSLDIMLYCFFEVESWNEELAARHRLLVDILRLAKQLSVNFAFPTQTLFMSKEKEAGNELASKQVIQEKENSAKLMAENISTQYY